MGVLNGNMELKVLKMHKEREIKLGETFEDAEKAYDGEYDKIIRSFSWGGEDDDFMRKECDILRRKVLPVLFKRATTLKQYEMILVRTNDSTNEFSESVKGKMELLQVKV